MENPKRKWEDMSFWEQMVTLGIGIPALAALCLVMALVFAIIWIPCTLLWAGKRLREKRAQIKPQDVEILTPEQE